VTTPPQEEWYQPADALEYDWYRGMLDIPHAWWVRDRGSFCTEAFFTPGGLGP